MRGDERTKKHLTLLECLHYWLCAQYQTETVLAVCKKCMRRGIFTYAEWNEMKERNEALDKPKRV